MKSISHLGWPVTDAPSLLDGSTELRQRPWSACLTAASAPDLKDASPQAAKSNIVNFQHDYKEKDIINGSQQRYKRASPYFAITKLH
jgi:hypothetical protein